MQTRRPAQVTDGPSSSSSSSSAVSVNVSVGVTPQAESTNATQTQLSPAVREPPKYMNKSMQTMLDGMKPEELQTVAKYIAARQAQQRLEVSEDDSYPPTLSSTLSRLLVRWIDESVEMDVGHRDAIVEIGQTRLLVTWFTERRLKHGIQHTQHTWTINTWSSSEDCDSIDLEFLYDTCQEGEQWFRAIRYDNDFGSKCEYKTSPSLTKWHQKQSQAKAKSSKARNNGNGKKVKVEDSEAEPMEEDIEEGEQEEEEEEEDEIDKSKDHALIVWLFKVFEESCEDLLDECFQYESTGQHSTTVNQCPCKHLGISSICLYCKHRPM